MSSRLIAQGQALRVAAQALPDHPRLHEWDSSGWEKAAALTHTIEFFSLVRCYSSDIFTAQGNCTAVGVAWSCALFLYGVPPYSTLPSNIGIARRLRFVSPLNSNVGFL
jgi:hypothetical protein